jgi:hypothetical protein
MSIVKSTLFEPYIPSNYDKTEHQKSFLYHNYSHSNEGDIYFTEKESKEYEKLINSLLNQKVNTTLTGKIYLGKLSSLPRHKIKDYFKENKVSKTSRLDQSDTIILNKEYLIEFNKKYMECIYKASVKASSDIAKERYIDSKKLITFINITQ